MKDIEKIVMDVINNSVPKNLRDSITLDSNLTEDLGFNSLKLLSLSVELEKKANFDVLRATEEADFTEIRTIKDIRNIVVAFQKNDA